MAKNSEINIPQTKPGTFIDSDQSLTYDLEIKIPQTKPGTFINIPKLSKIQSKNKNQSEVQSLNSKLDSMSGSTPNIDLKSQIS